MISPDDMEISMHEMDYRREVQYTFKPLHLANRVNERLFWKKILIWISTFFSMIMHNWTVKSTYFAKKMKKICVFVVEIKLN